MTKTALLATSALVALFTGGASAGAAHHPMMGVKGAPVQPNHVLPPSTLYSQNSNGSGSAIVSQNFTSGTFTQYDAALADDFAVPAGKKWKIKQVDVTGLYFNTTTNGPASSEVVTFYTSKKGRPGKLLHQYTVVGTDTCGTGCFSMVIPTTKAKGGAAGKSYFVSVVANEPFTTSGRLIGEWGWEGTLNAIQGSQSQWENPGNGFATGCTTWKNTSSCLGNAATDLMFDLQGTSN